MIGLAIPLFSLSPLARIRSSFGRFLTANGVASLVGIGMQAALPPLLLHFLRIEAFALWALSAAVAGIYSQLFNAFFYAGMNRYDSAWRTRDEAEARRTLSAMNVAMFGLTAISTAGLAFSAGWGASKTAPFAIGLAVLNTTLGFAYIMIDTHYRAIDRFVWGTNVLTGLRIVEWGVTAGAAAWFRALMPILLAVLGFKIAVVGVQVLFSRGRWGPPTRDAATAATWRALAAAGYRIFTAQAVLGSLLNTPQIALGAAGGGVESASFNVHRIYMRLGGLLTNVLTAASWPILSQRYAQGDHRGAARHMGMMTGLSVLVSILSTVVFVAAAPVLFNLVFRGKVALDQGILLALGVAVVANGVTNCALMYVVATSARVAGLNWLLWPLALAPGLLFLAARTGDLLRYAIGYAALETGTAVVCASAVFLHLRALGAGHAAA